MSDDDAKQNEMLSGSRTDPRKVRSHPENRVEQIQADTQQILDDIWNYSKCHAMLDSKARDRRREQFDEIDEMWLKRLSPI